MIGPEATSPIVPVTAQVLREAEGLSADILKDIELSQAPLSIVALKALRLARILNDFDIQQIFEWESGGYPLTSSGVNVEVWQAATRAGRQFFKKDPTSENRKAHVYVESIEKLEHTVAVGTISLQAAHDPDVSISSANQYQRIPMPQGNAIERTNIRSGMDVASGRLASRRTFIYNYASRKHYEIKFSSLADDVFARVRSFVDSSIGIVVPDAVKKLTAVYDNLRSDNPEDWANAVHSCRRVLQDLADAVFPAQIETRIRYINGGEREVKLGADQYINRLMAYIEDSSESSRFEEIVGSQLTYIGDRLDALFHAAQKGSHSTVTMEEADRCVVHTYLLVGDILSLSQSGLIPTQLDVDNEIGSRQEGDGEIAFDGQPTS